MKKKKFKSCFYLLFVPVLLMNGCQSQNEKHEQPITTHELSTSEGNEIVSSIKDINGVKDVKMVHSNNKLLLAVKITNFDRLNIEKITKKVQKKAEKQYPNMDVTVSPDKKIYQEINQLEQKNTKDHLNERSLDKKVKNLIKLSKEES